jgi:Ca2+-binding RTX toxin-like protein
MASNTPKRTTKMTVVFGPEFLVNSATDGSQQNSDIVALADGRFLVTWTDFEAQVGEFTGAVIKAQIFNANGSKAGGEFQVSQAGFLSQGQASVAALADGGFVISWTDGSSNGEVPSGSAIRAQRYDADGNRVEGVFVVNTTTTGNQHEPAVTALDDGKFIITWRDESQTGGDTNGSAVRAQIYDADGERLGDELLINSTKTRDQSQPAITLLADGRFVVSYSDGSASGADASSAGVRAQIFNANGTKSGGEFLVNTLTNGDQFASTITALADGGFVISWTDFGANSGAGSQADIRAQVFDANGVKVGAELLVNSSIPGIQSESSVAALADGRFVVSWTDIANNVDIKAQVFNADGTKSGEEFVVNSTTISQQSGSSITVLEDGRFVISWDDFSELTGDKSSGGILAQIFDPRIAAVDLAGTALDDDFVGTRFGDSLGGDAGNDRIDGGRGNDSIVGGQGRDHLLGNVGNDSMSGDAGNDQLFGAAGNDSLIGGDGDDVLKGDAGADRLFGDAGKDRLFAGAGKDALTGGADQDVFIFTKISEISGDRITDFQHGVDDIDLRAFMKGGEFIGGQAFGGEGDQVRYVKASGLLQGDVNGDGKADWSLTIVNKAALSAADFIF